MAVAVFDVGKTNVKLLVVGPDGEILERSGIANRVLQDGAFRRHDLGGTEAWLFETLGTLAQRHKLEAFVTSAHGSAGVPVRPDDLDRSDPICPMLDYEQDIPDWLCEQYEQEGGGFEDRGSAILHGALHQARQLLWLEREMPDALAAATDYLCLPQYWAWRLSGVAAAEITYMAAQSGLWNLTAQRPSEIVTRRAWTHFLPPFRKAWESLGTIRPELAKRYGLPADMRILTGIHDSSANFYGYQAMGFSGFSVVSTGTWIVGMSDSTPFERLDPARGMTCNADPDGGVVGGVMTMGGREFSAITGSESMDVPASPEAVAQMVARGTMALPTFGADDGLFPGTAGRGRIVGTVPKGEVEAKSLAILQCALLSSQCLEALGKSGTVLLDGAYIRDPLFAGLMAALNPDAQVFVNARADGVALGAAQLAHHGRGPLSETQPARAEALAIPELESYASTWKARATRNRKETQA
ncbi:FGGY family carbohydrate kinase [Tropicimonas sp. TH_r6]|uniref:FGGY-family carbohydrate kinase n=1 Tax=Tropicimonas sp. TH_r6 TaxID=3082085 RepID=UPI0029551D4C|nr:FGGY family carbohydrate kinase [Tropicimonas sp. TH_r6]MDV7145563.1 FGGY family carbohydrate kinase [Tropicimonas sp. TH_r6]